MFLDVFATAECDIAVVRPCLSDCQVVISQTLPHDPWMLQTAKLNSTDSKLQGTLSKAWVWPQHINVVVITHPTDVVDVLSVRLALYLVLVGRHEDIVQLYLADCCLTGKVLTGCLQALDVGDSQLDCGLADVYAHGQPCSAHLHTPHHVVYVIIGLQAQLSPQMLSTQMLRKESV